MIFELLDAMDRFLNPARYQLCTNHTVSSVRALLPPN
jgi:hypothetical protein